MENHRNMERKIKGVMFHNRFCPLWGGVYVLVGNPSFFRGGLDGLSRTIKAEMHDAGVVVEYETERDNL